ncbi:PilZ domain-containing protein, partial [Acinetobacter baumannii]
MLLNALAVLEQPRVPEGEEHAVLRQELFRLEAKLDLVTSIAARLLARYEQTPPLAGVRLTARGFAWLDGAPQGGAGETGVIELHA